MSKKELIRAVNNLNTAMPKSSSSMVQRMNETKSKVENSRIGKSQLGKTITISSGI